jgi:hypothetical protein
MASRPGSEVKVQQNGRIVSVAVTVALASMANGLSQTSERFIQRKSYRDRPQSTGQSNDHGSAPRAYQRRQPGGVAHGDEQDRTAAIAATGRESSVTIE